MNRKGIQIIRALVVKRVKNSVDNKFLHW